MATTVVSVTASAYSLLTVNDALVQNISSYPIRVVFDTSLPAQDTANFHTLLPGQALPKTVGVPVGNIYARCENTAFTSDVAVSE